MSDIFGNKKSIGNNVYEFIDDYNTREEAERNVTRIKHEFRNNYIQFHYRIIPTDTPRGKVYRLYIEILRNNNKPRSQYGVY